MLAHVLKHVNECGLTALGFLIFRMRNLRLCRYAGRPTPHTINVEGVDWSHPSASISEVFDHRQWRTLSRHVWTLVQVEMYLS